MKIILATLAVALLSTATAFAARTTEGIVYTLYRGSTVIGQARIHVATFDADAEEGYNKENCEIAHELFQGQQGVKVKYWCEKGYFSGK